jgi:hypothetical protein
VSPSRAIGQNSASRHFRVLNQRNSARQGAGLARATQVLIHLTSSPQVYSDFPRESTFPRLRGDKFLYPRHLFLHPSEKKLTSRYLFLCSSEKKLTLRYLFLSPSEKKLTSRYLFLCQSEQKLTLRYLFLYPSEKDLTPRHLFLYRNEEERGCSAAVGMAAFCFR